MTDRSVDSVPLGESIGENLARLRKVRDLSQERLAEAADVGVDTVARLEQAKRSNVRPVTLRKLADALSVSVDDLIGRPSARRSEKTDITGLRRAITAADGELRDLDVVAEPEETSSLEQLIEDTRQAWRAYVGGRHSELLNTLPIILFDGQRLVHVTVDDEKAGAYRALSTAYRLGAGITGRLGYLDLSWLAGTRAIVESLDLTAEPASARLVQARFSLEEQHFDLKGSVERTERGPVIDARLESPGVDLVRLLPQPKVKEEKKDKANVWPLTD